MEGRDGETAEDSRPWNSQGQCAVFFNSPAGRSRIPPAKNLSSFQGSLRIVREKRDRTARDELSALICFVIGGTGAVLVAVFSWRRRDDINA